MEIKCPDLRGFMVLKRVSLIATISLTMSNTPGELTNTLVLALSQCQDQIQTICDQAARVEQLQLENTRLRTELQNATQKQRDAVAPEDSSSQVDDLFQKHVEAQAEIQRLKKKLKQYKDKANNLLAVPLSSPSTRSSTPSPRSPRSPLRQSRIIEATSIHVPSSPPRKRLRLEKEALREVSLNTAHNVSPTANTSEKSISEKNAAAFPLVGEDTQRYRLSHEPENIDDSTVPSRSSVYHQLDGLLAASTPRSPLTLSASLNPRPVPVTPPVTVARAFNISNMSHVTSETPPPKVSKQQNSSNKEPSANEPAIHVSRSSIVQSHHASSLHAQDKISKRRRDDDDPLRARPLSGLALKHFKPNPRWLDSHGVSYDEFLRGQNAKRIGALAATLPRLPGQHEQSNAVADDELLLEFLGPGSEDRITRLTQVARTNLIMEARTKHIAKYFARQRADYDREQDPPGFWSIDMPDTQEGEDNRKKAIRLEEEEIKKRYDDAVSGHGRWIFADE